MVKKITEYFVSVGSVKVVESLPYIGFFPYIDVF